MKTKVKQKWLCGISIIAVCFMLTGCCMNHEWQEATCAEPKTCAKCGKTEGEALGHTWVEATCAEPKHCSVCSETEGESLEHTLTEANYQQPATCEVCGETVGEPLQAQFEKYGLVCNAEQNKKYPMIVSGGGLTTIAGKVVFSDYEVFDSDDTHEAKEGYEWRTITVTTLFDEIDAKTCYALGITPIPSVMDYYYDWAYNESTYNESTHTYTLNYNGVDYTDVKFDFETLQNDWNDDVLTFQYRYFFRVPKGYDGLVALADTTLHEGVSNIADLNNDNVFFRLK